MLDESLLKILDEMHDPMRKPNSKNPAQIVARPDQKSAYAMPSCFENLEGSATGK
jgi:hypothetical protein